MQELVGSKCLIGRGTAAGRGLGLVPPMCFISQGKGFMTRLVDATIIAFMPDSM